MKLHPGFGPNSHKVIISLCDYSGRWPSKYITEDKGASQHDPTGFLPRIRSG